MADEIFDKLADFHRLNTLYADWGVWIREDAAHAMDGLKQVFWSRLNPTERRLFDQFERLYVPRTVSVPPPPPPPAPSVASPAVDPESPVLLMDDDNSGGGGGGEADDSCVRDEGGATPAPKQTGPRKKPNQTNVTDEVLDGLFNKLIAAYLNPRTYVRVPAPLFHADKVESLSNERLRQDITLLAEMGANRKLVHAARMGEYMVEYQERVGIQPVTALLLGLGLSDATRGSYSRLWRGMSSNPGMETAEMNIGDFINLYKRLVAKIYAYNVVNGIALNPKFIVPHGSIVRAALDAAYAAKAAAAPNPAPAPGPVAEQPPSSALPSPSVVAKPAPMPVPKDTSERSRIEYAILQRNALSAQRSYSDAPPVDRPFVPLTARALRALPAFQGKITPKPTPPPLLPAAPVIGKTALKTAPPVRSVTHVIPADEEEQEIFGPSDVQQQAQANHRQFMQDAKLKREARAEEAKRDADIAARAAEDAASRKRNLDEAYELELEGRAAKQARSP